jgi:hypothetical protein
MPGLRLAPRVDLAVFYEADRLRYAARTHVTERVTRDAFVAFYADCPSMGFECDGQPIGGVVFDGEQAHIAVLPSYHGRWALLLKPMLHWLFGLKPEIIVRVEADNVLCLRFMERNGWQRLGVDGDDVVYRMTPQNGTRKTEYPFRRG